MTNKKTAEKSRDHKGRFKKGHSGNPSGRPKRKPLPKRDYRDIGYDYLNREISVKEPDGTRRRTTPLRRLIECAAEVTHETPPKEAMDLLVKLHKLGVLQKRMPPDPFLLGHPYVEEHGMPTDAPLMTEDEIQDYSLDLMDKHLDQTEQEIAELRRAKSKEEATQRSAKAAPAESSGRSSSHSQEPSSRNDNRAVTDQRTEEEPPLIRQRSRPPAPSPYDRPKTKK
ncbi:DUF5681 domain-containing protein [Sphingomicrobium sediminis]|uniref:DUF5681 domain-containing protein n=1 Tax=Sphingomicrobium sediminis TaxID=2950949 RepID=A0A9X2EJY4_9SPHN|nr:DUF5681 domain-containing protein [Sphingomicrobium sediminis]MCM8556667.1 DUF5681 domain-containing protein [Sphingomicrobium sediminis]